MIDGYKFGEFVIDKKVYKSNVELVGTLVKIHRYLPDHELSLDDFTSLVNSKPEVIIIGTGAYGVVKPPKTIIDFIEKQKIKVIVQKTGDACKTYNEMLKQGKKVVALLHNTC
jgi:hypothetical protein